MEHDHGHDAWTDEPHPYTRGLTIVAWALLGVVLIGMVVLWPTEPIATDPVFFASDVVPATVERVRQGPCRNVEDLTCTKVTYLIEGGAYEGSHYVEDFFGDITDPDLEVGDGVMLNYTEGADIAFAFQYADRQRRPVLWWLSALFALSVVALGRWRGVSALAALGSSFAVLLGFVLPALVTGRPPLPVALVGAAAVAYLTLYIGHGIGARTTVALLGSLLSLALVGVLGALAVEAAALSGLATEEAVILPLLTSAIDFRGLVLAGIVLGTMGALDDVTVTQTEAIWELFAANPDLPRRDLYAAGMRIGRAHIGSTVNTLALAYAGAALPLLLLFLIADQSLSTIANSEVVATEIIRTLAGSIGLVSSVPLTTWLAARIVGGATKP